MVRWKGWAFVYVRDMNQAFHINETMLWWLERR